MLRIHFYHDLAGFRIEADTLGSHRFNISLVERFGLCFGCRRRPGIRLRRLLDLRGLAGDANYEKRDQKNHRILHTQTIFGQSESGVKCF